LLWAGPVAIVQAAIVSLVTFGVIYYSAVRLGLDRRLAATLGTGGAVCGVSGRHRDRRRRRRQEGGRLGRDRARGGLGHRDDLHIAARRALACTSRRASRAPGSAPRNLPMPRDLPLRNLMAAMPAMCPGIAGSADAAVAAFTLMKVIGRDIWIGVWAFVLSLIATARWERTGIETPQWCRRNLAPVSEIRSRLPDRLGARHVDLARLRLFRTTRRS
jgi:hypothetical protein